MNEFLTNKELKEECLRCLKELDIYEPYIEAFEKNGTVTWFEGFGGYYVQGQNMFLDNKINELEEKYKIKIYAITHERFEFGECYSFIYVSKYREELAYNINKIDENKYIVSAYVYNCDEPMFSEFGDICVETFGGGIKRLG